MLNSKKQASQIQREIIETLQEGNSFGDVMDANREIILQWYNLGKKGNEIYVSFYNQLNSLFPDELMAEDIRALTKSIRFSNKYFLNRDNLILFNSPKTIDGWYRKGRDGDKSFRQFYSDVKEFAFADLIGYDERLIRSLLNDGKTLEEALDSPKLFSTREEFKSMEHLSLRPEIERHNQDVIAEGLNGGEMFDDLIRKDNVYSSPEQILSWYKLGRLNRPEYKEFYQKAFPFVIRQDYNKVRKAIDDGVPLEKLAKLPGVISTQEEFKEYLINPEDEDFEAFFESDIQRMIFNECMRGKSFKEVINKGGFYYSPKQIEIWYKLGRGGDSKYKPFFDMMSPFVLRDDCKVIFAAVNEGKTFLEAIEEPSIIASGEFIVNVFSSDEFESDEIERIVGDTIDLLVSNTNYSREGFAFDEDNENIRQWVELGRLGIRPFTDFYGEYLIFKTQKEVIRSLRNDELFINAINDINLKYSQDEIFDWYMKGKSGEKYVEFYEICSGLIEDETKAAILDSLTMYKSLNQAIRENAVLHSEDEIRQWLDSDRPFHDRCEDIVSQFKDNINSVDDLLTPKFEDKLKSGSLSAEDYDDILEAIYQNGKRAVEFDESDGILEKISKVVSAYAQWSYKSKGGELGYYKSNAIKLDDRLLDSQKISTLIHELTHHLVAEILEEAMCCLLDVEKSQAIEGFVGYFLTDSLTKIMNEFCASTVEGRFIPLGYQNYGAYNIAMDSCAADDETKTVWKYIGNTMADDIIEMLEKFIGSDLREEIKTQFKEDMFPPSYLEVGTECLEIFPKQTMIDLLYEALIDYYNLAKDSDEHKKILDYAYADFDSCYQ